MLLLVPVFFLRQWKGVSKRWQQCGNISFPKRWRFNACTGHLHRFPGMGGLDWIEGTERECVEGIWGQFNLFRNHRAKDIQFAQFLSNKSWKRWGIQSSLMLPPCLSFCRPVAVHLPEGRHKFATFYLYRHQLSQRAVRGGGDCFLENRTILMVFLLDTFTGGVFNKDCFMIGTLFHLANGKIYLSLFKVRSITL